MTYPEELKALNQLIEKKIQQYADEHGISYEEAAKRAYLTYNGTEIKPVEAVAIDIPYVPTGELNDT